MELGMNRKEPGSVAVLVKLSLFICWATLDQHTVLSRPPSQFRRGRAGLFGIQKVS
jgi:hypothetical protein